MNSLNWTQKYKVYCLRSYCNYCFPCLGRTQDLVTGGSKNCPLQANLSRGCGGMFPREIVTVRSLKRDFFILLISLNETTKHC